MLRVSVKPQLEYCNNSELFACFTVWKAQNEKGLGRNGKCLKTIMLFTQQGIYLNSCSIMGFLWSKQIQTFTLRTSLWAYLFDCSTDRLLSPGSWRKIRSRIMNPFHNCFFAYVKKEQIFLKISLTFLFLKV